MKVQQYQVTNTNSPILLRSATRYMKCTFLHLSKKKTKKTHHLCSISVTFLQFETFAFNIKVCKMIPLGKQVILLRRINKLNITKVLMDHVNFELKCYI